MKVLVLGSAGNMGRRYCSILKYCGIDHVGIDLGPNYLAGDGITHVLIATPISEHYRNIKGLLEKTSGLSILCEKPICKEIDQILELQKISKETKTPIYMVNNWRFILGRWRILQPENNCISLDYYNTGKDGDWDLIQSIYLSRGMPNIKRSSPVYDCSVNGTMITQHNFDLSYVAMIRAWLDIPQLMWTLDDAIKATEKTIKYMESHA